MPLTTAREFADNAEKQRRSMIIMGGGINSTGTMRILFTAQS